MVGAKTAVIGPETEWCTRDSDEGEEVTQGDPQTPSVKPGGGQNFWCVAGEEEPTSRCLDPWSGSSVAGGGKGGEECLGEGTDDEWGGVHLTSGKEPLLDGGEAMGDSTAGAPLFRDVVVEDNEAVSVVWGGVLAPEPLMSSGGWAVGFSEFSWWSIVCLTEAEEESGGLRETTVSSVQLLSVFASFSSSLICTKKKDQSK